MDDRPVVWDAANQSHLGQAHPERHISLDEIDEVLSDAGRIETYLAGRRAYQGLHGRPQADGWS